MAHAHLQESVRAQTGKATLQIVGILLGGVLVLNSYIAYWVSGDPFFRDVLALVAALLLAWPIIRHAVHHLWEGVMHMDELVAIAVLAALAVGEYQAAAVVSFFVMLSNLMEERTALGARASIESLLRITPTQASRVGPGDTEEQVDAAVLRPGDIVRVRPGDNIPADGVVTSGDSTVNQASITGESLPADKKINDDVYSGSINLTGAMDIRVTKAGEDTTLGRVKQLILQAERTRIPISRLIDRYAAWYTPVILMVALIVLFFTREIDRAIAILVIACPCALVLATPTAMVAALSAAARLGVLVKNVVDLERVRSLTAVIFDKTGTLTTGELAVTRMRPAPGVDGAELLWAAASAEQNSNHPVAKAVVQVAKKAKVALKQPSTFKEVPGRGVICDIDSANLRVGRLDWLKEQGDDMSITEQADFAEIEGLSMLYVAKNGKCLGWIALEDRTRPEARAAIDELRARGIRQITMVTGDRRSVAQRVGQEMGCTDVHAEVLPQQKLELVDQTRSRGHRVLVIGDGVNDAPALAAGDIGIAMGAAGSDVAINSATIALMNNKLNRVPFLIQLSRATMRVVNQNLAFGLLFIVIFVTLSAMGRISPIVAALLHNVGSVIVIFNSARLVRRGEQLEHAADAEAPPASDEPPAVVPRPAMA